MALGKARACTHIAQGTVATDSVSREDDARMRSSAGSSAIRTKRAFEAEKGTRW